MASIGTLIRSYKVGVVRWRVIPFPNKPWLLRVCTASLLKTLVMSNFSFSHNIFYRFLKTLRHFHQVWNCPLQIHIVIRERFKKKKVENGENACYEQHFQLFTFNFLSFEIQIILWVQLFFFCPEILQIWTSLKFWYFVDSLTLYQTTKFMGCPNRKH